METKLFPISTAVLVLLHNAGTIFHWYDTFYSFDKIIHLLAGFWVAHALFLLSSRYQILSFPKDRFLNACIILVSLAMLVGVFWEFFEIGLGKISMMRHGVGIENHFFNRTDTASDLFFDFIGATAAALILLPKHKKETG